LNFNQPGRSNPVEVGHADVHHDDSRLELLYGRHSLFSIGGFAHDLNIWIRLQDRPQSLAYHGMIINDQNPNFLCCGHFRE
jgi:hypothetical protein